MFKSFFLGGFECATGFNAQGEWIDQVEATQHDRFLDEDYSLLKSVQIQAAREGVRWPLIDRGGTYDFSTLDPVLRASENHGLDLILDLFHYGYPMDLDPFSGEFVDRFAGYCYAVAKRVRKLAPHNRWFTPINEPSYFAWAAADAGVFAPYAHGRSFELKVNLIRAAIRGIDSIRSVMPECRIVNADPLCRVCCPRDRCELEEEVHHFNESVVFQSFDMLCGRLLPELGGSPAHLDIVGVNYYWTNQWEHTVVGLPLSEDDERCWPLTDLIRWVWHRYGHEMLITETMHSGDHRGPYLQTLRDELRTILDERIPLLGACLYPILGMPEWHDRNNWARMGLWDLHPNALGELERVPYNPALEALASMQRVLAPQAAYSMR